MTKSVPDGVLKPDLWTDRPVQDTMAVYADWAATYDEEVRARGSRTPGRLAAELLRRLGDLDHAQAKGVEGFDRKGVGHGVWALKPGAHRVDAAWGCDLW